VFGRCPVDLTEYARRAAGRLSGGWARRLQLAAALIHSPKLILLDEPTAGLDAMFRQEVWQRIGRLAAQGRASSSALMIWPRPNAAPRPPSFRKRVVAVGTPEQIARSAPAAAFSLSGGGARLLGECVEVLPGVIASYPQGSSLRVVADPKAEESLQRLASSYSASTAGVPMRFEDAVLAFSGRRAEA
jgi:ABC-2 type transport system ATP-binding protein